MRSRLLVLSMLVTAAWAYESYVTQIPNGDKVPNPCPGGGIWIGSGHFKIEGGGSRDQFGLDFASYGHNWTAVCHVDSDGDGRTNGQELGDPDCVWTNGTAPNRTTDITHPSVCEPITFLNCSSRPQPPQRHGRNYTDQADWLNVVCGTGTTTPNGTGVTSPGVASLTTQAPGGVTTPGGTGVSSTTTQAPGDVTSLTPGGVTTPGGNGVAAVTTLPCLLLQLTCFMSCVFLRFASE